MKIEILILSIIILFGFSGCTHKKLQINTIPSKEYVINYNEIKVKDFALETDIKVSDIVWVNGWVPMHKGLTPELHEVLYKKISQGIKGNGKGERLDIAIVHAGLFMEKNFADDMVFIQFFRVGAERGFKCTGTLNIESSTSSKRITLEHEIKRSYFNSQEEMSTFVSDCEDKILEKTYEFITNDFK